MLNKHEIPVPIPEETNGVRILTYNNGYVYIVTEAKWDPVTKNSKDDRKCIGKICETDNSMMYPNKYYKKEYCPLYPEQHYLLHNNNITCGVFIGALRAADKMGILTALQMAFPNQWRKIFASSVYWIDTQSSKAQKFEYWFFDNYSGIYAAMDSSAFTKLFEDIQTNGHQMDVYRKTFATEYCKRFPSTNETRRAYGCDGTNFNTTDDDNELSGYGHAKEDDDTPIVNVMSFVDEETGVTVFWDYFPGPVLDKSQILYSMDKAKTFGFSNVHIMMDRGFLTMTMIELFNELKKERGIVCSAMVPGTYKIVEAAVAAYQFVLPRNQNYYIPDMHIYGMKLTEDFVIHKAPDFLKDGKPIIEFFLFYDDIRASKEIAALNDKVSMLEKSLLQRKEYTEKLVKDAGKYLTVHKCENGLIDGREFTITRNNDTIQKAGDLLGFFLIASNADSTAAMEIVIARKRDHNEKAYRRRKTFFDLTTPDTEKNDTFTGKMIVADIAQNIEEAMEYYGKPFINLKTSETVSTMIGELHKIKMSINQEGGMQTSFPLTKEQKQIMACFNLEEEDVISYVKSLNWGKNYEEIYNAKELRDIEKMKKKAEQESKKAEREAQRRGKRKK